MLVYETNFYSFNNTFDLLTSYNNAGAIKFMWN